MFAELLSLQSVVAYTAPIGDKDRIRRNGSVKPARGASEQLHARWIVDVNDPVQRLCVYLRASGNAGSVQ